MFKICGIFQVFTNFTSLLWHQEPNKKALWIPWAFHGIQPANMWSSCFFTNKNGDFQWISGDLIWSKHHIPRILRQHWGCVSWHWRFAPESNFCYPKVVEVVKFLVPLIFGIPKWIITNDDKRPPVVSWLSVEDPNLTTFCVTNSPCSPWDLSVQNNNGIDQFDG